MWEQSMGLWKGGRELERAELTPLCITTGAEQLGSTSWSTGGGQVVWKRTFSICQLLQCPGQVFAVWQHKKAFPGESPGQSACPMQSGLPQTSGITTIDCYSAASWGHAQGLWVSPGERCSRTGFPVELSFGSWTSLLGAQLWVQAYSKALYQEFRFKAESLLPGRKCHERHQSDGNGADIPTHVPNPYSENAVHLLAQAGCPRGPY